MRKRSMIAVSLLCIVISGCCAAYKAAVTKYAEQLPARGKIYYQKIQTLELRKEVVIQDAALACLVDKDQNQSTASNPSAACKCSEGKPDDWQSNCQEWLALSK